MKTVKVRIAVAVDAKGKWSSCGWPNGNDAELMEIAVESVDDGETRYFIEADLAIPEPPQTVQATVTNEP